MESAMQLLVLILGGLLLGQWLQNRFGTPPLLTILLPVLGMVIGLMILYKNASYPKKGDTPPSSEPPSSSDPKTPPGP